MSTVNIPSYIDDPNYRYKMPKVRAKVEGRGNGVRTNIMNMGEIARALKRVPEYPTRFAGCELGSSAKFDAAEGKAIVNGAHTESDVQVVVDKFVERFVLCPNCKLPEIDLHVAKGLVKGKCNACGFAGPMDNTHKLSTFILKNPPGGGDSTMGKKSSKSSKAERRSMKAAAAAKQAESDGGVLEETEGGGHHRSSRHKSSSHKSKDSHSGEDVAEVDSGAEEEKDTKKEKKKKHETEEERAARKAKRRAQREAKKNATQEIKEDEDEEAGFQLESKEATVVIQRLHNYLRKSDEDSTGNDNQASKFFQEVRVLQVANGFDSTARLYVALAAIGWNENTESVSLSADVMTRRKAEISAMLDRSTRGEHVLEAIELLLAQRATDSYSKLPLICKFLYDEEFVSEEDILSRWGTLRTTTDDSEDGDSEASTTTSTRKAAEAAGVFLKWLREAESASESEDGDESDDD